METHYYTTTINCASCVAKVTPFLDQEPLIEAWSVNTALPSKLLTIEGAIDPSKLTELIEKAGFNITGTTEKIDFNAGSAEANKEQFWSDTNVWGKASFNTLNCLIGCTIGDFSMMIYLQLNYPELNNWIVMTFAIITGLITSVLLETILLKLKEKLKWTEALKIALMMSFLSMVVMELAENITDLILTGGEFHAHQPYYWFVLVFAMIMGFLVPLPYNYYKLKKYNKSCH